MTDLAWTLLAAAAVFAVGDWIAVLARNKPLEYVCKPATMVLLIGVALALDPRHGTQRWAFVAAIAFSLAGDVFLMAPAAAPRESAGGSGRAAPPRGRFVPGLLSFFVAHVAYIVGLRVDQDEYAPLLLSALVVFVAMAIVGRRILFAVRAGFPELGTPVAAYIAVIAVMVACALASGNALAATGAVLFMVSDTLIAWNRFVRELDWAPITIIVTYHLAQASLVLSLAL